MSEGAQHSKAAKASSTESTSDPGTRRRLFIAAAALAVAVSLGAATALADSAPTVTIATPTAVTFNSAHLAGTVNPQGGPSATHWAFEYTTEPGEPSSWVQTPGGEHEIPDPDAEETNDFPVEEDLTGLNPGTEYFVRLHATNEEGANSALSEEKSFETEAVNPPSVTNLQVTAITAGSAHFKGTVNSGGPNPGEATTWRFQCEPECPGLSEGQGVTSDGNDQEVSEDANSLEPNTPYTVKLVASNAGGEALPAEQSFETEAIGPDAATGLAGDPTSTETDLLGYVNPNNSPTTYFFEYGSADCSANPCTSVPASQDADAGSGNENHRVVQHIAGLQPNTTSHFRIVADNGVGGPVSGDDHAFTTFPAPATGPCPNEQIRQQQRSTRLGDCRAYELISSVSKNSVIVNSSALSLDGTRVLFVVVGGVSEGGASIFTATRGAQGWEPHSILPPRDQIVDDLYQLIMASNDLTHTIMLAAHGILNASAGSLVRLDVGQTQTVLEDFTLGEMSVASNSRVALVSDDAQHVFIDSSKPTDPGHQPETLNVYDYGVEPPLLISRLPDGSVPACGVSDQYEFASGGPGNLAGASEHWNSSGGSRLFFQSRGNDAPDCDDPSELYRRDIAAGETTLISGPALSGDSDATFLQASADGSAVVYATTASLTVDDTNSDPDVYRWTEGVGNECLTCVVADAAVRAKLDQTSAGGFSTSLAVSEDLSHVYFDSQKELAPGATEGVDNLYVWHQGQIDYVSPFDLDTNNLTGEPLSGGDLTPDGNVLIFRAAGLSAADNGTQQYYRYDDRDGSVTCVSCPPAGMPAPTTDVQAKLIFASVGGVEVNGRTVSDDGSRFFFSTSSPLVPGDSNGASDVYEWHDGTISLISDGTSIRGSTGLDQLVTVSADGRDALFTSFSRLTPGVPDDARQLYDARIDGGFAEPPTPAPCAGEGCQGAPSSASAGATAGSAAFAGPGNARANRQRHHRRRHNHRSHKRSAFDNRRAHR